MNTVVIIWFAAPESIPEVIEATRAEDLKHLLVNALSTYAAQDGDCSDQLSSISNVVTQILEKGSKCDLPLHLECSNMPVGGQHRFRSGKKLV